VEALLFDLRLLAMGCAKDKFYCILLRIALPASLTFQAQRTQKPLGFCLQYAASSLSWADAADCSAGPPWQLLFLVRTEMQKLAMLMGGRKGKRLHGGVEKRLATGRAQASS
jgi:hypothetical protein